MPISAAIARPPSPGCADCRQAQTAYSYGRARYSRQEAYDYLAEMDLSEPERLQLESVLGRMSRTVLSH